MPTPHDHAIAHAKAQITDAQADGKAHIAQGIQVLHDALVAHRHLSGDFTSQARETSRLLEAANALCLAAAQEGVPPNRQEAAKEMIRHVGRALATS